MPISSSLLYAYLLGPMLAALLRSLRVRLSSLMLHLTARRALVTPRSNLLQFQLGPSRYMTLSLRVPLSEKQQHAVQTDEQRRKRKKHKTYLCSAILISNYGYDISVRRVSFPGSGGERAKIDNGSNERRLLSSVRPLR